MQELSYLQEIGLFSRYAQNDERADLKAGCSNMLAIKDISYAMPEDVKHT